MAVVTIEIDGRTIDENRRIETLSKWAIKDSIRWKKRADSEPWLPIPTRAIPAGIRANVNTRLIDGSLRQILEPQSVPPKEIVFVLTSIETLRLQFAAGMNRKFVLP